MEGQERRHLEARISVLRDIQTLLDAAVLQMNQYGVLVARLEQESTNNNIVSRSSTNEEVPSPTSSSAASTLPQAEVAEASLLSLRSLRRINSRFLLQKRRPT